MKPSSHEKRTSDRIPVSMTVSSEDFDPVGFGYAVNISEKGLRVDAQALVESKIIPAVGTLLKLKFKLPSSTYYLSLEAKIIYIEHDTPIPQIGFTFVDVPDDVLHAIKEYVAQHRK